MSEKKKLEYWKKYDDIRMRRAARLQYEIAKTFRSLQKEIKSKLKNKKGLDKKFDGDLFDSEKWKELLDGNTTPERRAALEELLKELLKEVGGSGGHDKDLSAALKDSSDKITSSIDTIQDDLKKTIQDIIDKNPLATTDELYAKIIASIDDKFLNNYTQSRAKTIAVTTTTYANGNMKTRVWPQYGFTAVWVSERDAKVRKTHRQADGQKPDSNGLYSVGKDKMKHPGAGKIAAENVNCRCDLFAEEG